MKSQKTAIVERDQKKSDYSHTSSGTLQNADRQKVSYDRQSARRQLRLQFIIFLVDNR
jgi:hypothetical protein